MAVTKRKSIGWDNKNLRKKKWNLVDWLKGKLAGDSWAKETDDEFERLLQLEESEKKMARMNPSLLEEYDPHAGEVDEQPFLSKLDRGEDYQPVMDGDGNIIEIIEPYGKEDFAKKSGLEIFEESLANYESPEVKEIKKLWEKVPEDSEVTFEEFAEAVRKQEPWEVSPAYTGTGEGLDMVSEMKKGGLLNRDPERKIYDPDDPFFAGGRSGSRTETVSYSPDDDDTDLYDSSQDENVEADPTGGFADSMSSKGGKITPMQKYGAGLIRDLFAEKDQPQSPQTAISRVTPGRTFDMSSLLASHKRPKRERYRNRGLITS